MVGLLYLWDYARLREEVDWLDLHHFAWQIRLTIEWRWNIIVLPIWVFWSWSICSPEPKERVEYLICMGKLNVCYLTIPSVKYLLVIRSESDTCFEILITPGANFELHIYCRKQWDPFLTLTNGIGFLSKTRASSQFASPSRNESSSTRTFSIAWQYDYQ